MSSSQRPVSRGVLIRYRIMAYVTAVLLLLLVFYAVPVQICTGDTCARMKVEPTTRAPNRRYENLFDH